MNKTVTSQGVPLKDYFDEKFTQLDRKVDKLLDSQEKDYVTKTEFEPIRRLVYGTVSLILTAVLVALVSTVVINVK